MHEFGGNFDWKVNNFIESLTETEPASLTRLTYCVRNKPKQKKWKAKAT